ncbi:MULTISPECIES: type II toxin-antitoxin system VapC family toxin [Rhizobium]|uniref:type II toxin-antitoxin system VapC family toxin n=1 Tax=Rhizobium TaxID=379 RepID=UPI0007EBF213|nr:MULTISPECIES: type II toxin-antitoxin system VapC family toxin [Rhizobium]ANK89977.1 toxin/antitoxin system PilT domain-containing protein [Rhizobium sp. N6212]ANK96004.1 toxin/antitoxin system PilT domain-containing protein [Rhizobium sp. N621]ANL02032.1 toxin/antitoxin system PilT domain-containing protein [Rhizobium esperanzae]ANL08160.1 toxin/antitoxin system PilT domain-containing protein [Rhizobium sp. N1341]ANL20206.1 toxin/antitoxin system PilT domain-containing protein [Rhizobium s
MIVLDTNVISELQGRTHSERILSWLDGYDVEMLFLTTIAVAEMRYGLELLDDGRRKATLISDFNRIESEFAGRVLGFSLSAANRYGLLAAQRRKMGRPMETKDGMIAAICLANGATLATRNTRDFEGLDLKLVNPFEDG